MNPLELRGPQFLVLYVLTAGAAVMVAAVLRWLLRQPADAADPPAELSPCDVAYLAGGTHLAINAALTRLIHEKCLKLDATNGTVAVERPAPADAEPLESALHAACAVESKPTLAWLHRQAGDEAAAIRSRLRELGLLVDSAHLPAVLLVPMTVIAAALAFGAAKLVIGVQRERPIGFLIALMAIQGVAMIGFLWPPFRSRRGDRLLAQLRRDNTALRTGASLRPEQMMGSDVSLALGLFGVAALSHESFAGLRQRMHPTHGAGAGSCGAGCGHGCGGGGCGGGGCGGGGCGGCGG
jgi:uncharacterized protein (TIGR04222 family)